MVAEEPDGCPGEWDPGEAWPDSRDAQAGGDGGERRGIGPGPWPGSEVGIQGGCDEEDRQVHRCFVSPTGWLLRASVAHSGFWILVVGWKRVHETLDGSTTFG